VAASAAAAAAPVGDVIMRTKEFLARLDHERIVNAIRTAEGKTSGEIRVFIQRGELATDALPLAEKKFVELGMQRTAERNAILILVAPRAQKFAIVGDEGVHQKCGDIFWARLVETMRAHFKRDAFTDALVEAIESAGHLLAEHFPRLSNDRNELSDDIIEG
jgi:uncharacterized membrane protein